MEIQVKMALQVLLVLLAKMELQVLQVRLAHKVMV
jgi:hypothetical protein